MLPHFAIWKYKDKIKVPEKYMSFTCILRALVLQLSFLPILQFNENNPLGILIYLAVVLLTAPVYYQGLLPILVLIIHSYI